MKRIGIVILPRFQILHLAVAAAFELANNHVGRPVYRVDVLSEHGGAVASSSGVTVDSKPLSSAKCDTLIVTGTIGIPSSSEQMRRFLRARVASARRVTGICTGAFILAEAGLLDGRRVTTHWQFSAELQGRFPQITVQQDRIFIGDGAVWTSAGMTAGIDLCVALVQEDLGADVSQSIAEKLLVDQHRLGGQSRYSSLLDLEPKSDRIHSTLSYAKANMQKSLSMNELAAVAGLSPRQFSRVFKVETGQSPARAIEGLRVQAARTLIDAGGRSLAMVAIETGFIHPERMRRAFLRIVGHPPQAIRRFAKEPCVARSTAC